MESRLPLCQRSTTLSSSTIRGDEDYQYWTVDGCFKNYTKDHNGQHFESVGFSYHEAEEEDNILFSTQNLDTYAH
ncbi:hypothetical protein EV182_004320 [Spiromyces aspiralis]|uniref:Uncharacterized protein n=1 Tax=Spiromyces aspiralis TaxID=68401 RepID=A0ACC1HJ23_9FUNG|nr:hypothetical protein EV182_004320 [Spiromyces aspiralis]